MVEFRILGAVNLLGADGRELRSVLAQSKRIALLAYLAAAHTSGFHRRDSLLALFWPELDQEHARAALRQALHGLRRSLGETAIESHGDQIRLSEQGVWCDVVAFDAAVETGSHVEALQLYRGSLLDGFFISGAPEFERWVENERDRLRRRAVESAWSLAESYRADAQVSLAAHWARHGTGIVRDDEGALRRLLALLGDLGDRAGALQAYDVFARRLAEEYEAEPAAETKALIAEIRSRENAQTADRRDPSEAHEFPRLDDWPRGDEAADFGDRAEGSDSDAASIAGVAPRAGEVPPALARHPGGQPSDPPGRRLRVVATAGLVMTLAAVTLGAALIWGPLSASGPDRDAVALNPARVVVAGFSNRTPDTALDGLTELARDEITRGLALTELVEMADPVANIAGGRVPATRSLPAGQEAGRARDLAIATGSGLAVWGAIDRRGGEIEITAQVVDERRGRILRTLEPVRGDPRNPRAALTTLRDRVMAVVAEAVDPRLAASASVGGDPPRYDAYIHFVTGVGIWYDGRNGRDALPHFRQATVVDSTFALPLIWAAWVHQAFGQCDSTEAIAGRLQALQLSPLERIQIDRQMARCRGDLPAAYRLAHALTDARPHSEVWQEQLARDALNFNRPREALEILARLHPDRGALRGRVSYYNWVTSARHLLGQHERELAVAASARSHFPGNLAAWRMELLALAALRRGGEVNARLDEIDAVASDPLRKKPTVMREIALDLRAHGDHAAAARAFGRTLAWHAMQPNTEQSTEFNRFERSQAYYAAGHADSARTIAEKLAAAHPRNVQYVGLLGVIAAARGDHALAAQMAERLDGLKQEYERGRSTYWRACIAAQGGRGDEAVQLLRRALAEGYVFNGFFFLSAHLEPCFATIRGNAPFEELLRTRG